MQFQRLGLNATTMMKNDPWNAFAMASAAGLKAVELTAGRSEHAMIRAEKDLSDVQEALRRSRETGLAINALGMHRDLSQKDGLDEYLLLLEKAARLNCPIATTGVPDGCAPQAFQDGVYRAACRAHELGVTICLETHGYGHGSGASLLPVTEAHPDLRICYDTANVLFYSDTTPVDDLPLCIGKIGHVHLKDKLGGKGEWSFPALGQGVVPFVELLALPGWPKQLGASIEIEFTPQGVDLAHTQQAIDASVQYLKCHSLLCE